MHSSNKITFSQPLKQVILSRQYRTGNESINLLDEPIVPEVPKIDLPQHEQAVKAAYEQGLNEGRALQQKEINLERELTQQKVSAIFSDITVQKQNLLGEIEALVPEIVIESVGRLLHGIEPSKEDVLKIVKEILSGFDSEDSEVRLYLNSDDKDLIEGSDFVVKGASAGLSLQEDPELTRGECYLEGRFGISDARFSAKLAGLRKVFE